MEFERRAPKIISQAWKNLLPAQGAKNFPENRQTGLIDHKLRKCEIVLHSSCFIEGSVVAAGLKYIELFFDLLIQQMSDGGLGRIKKMRMCLDTSSWEFLY